MWFSTRSRTERRWRLTDCLVGVVANPASGRDIRRLVSGASVFDNTEKGSMIVRLLGGLGAVAVDRALLMPAGDGVAESLHRHLRGRTGMLLSLIHISEPTRRTPISYA